MTITTAPPTAPPTIAPRWDGLFPEDEAGTGGGVGVTVMVDAEFDEGVAEDEGGIETDVKGIAGVRVANAPIPVRAGVKEGTGVFGGFASTDDRN